MPIVIEDIETEVMPEQAAEVAAPREERAEEEQRRWLLERVRRELRIRDERAGRWYAD